MARPTLAAPKPSDPFTTAVRAMRFGKLLPGARYVHADLYAQLPAEVRDGVERALSLSGDRFEDVQLLKLGSLAPTVSLLRYPGFWSEPFPALAESVSVNLETGKVSRRVWPQNDAVPILHRKETFISRDHPLHARLAKMTGDLETRGLLTGTSRIGQRGFWEKRLRDAGVEVVDHEVLSTRSNPRRGGELLRQLEALRPEFAAAAQRVYDGWDQGEDGMCEGRGGGGICDEVAEALGGVISSRLRGVSTTDGGQDGDDHAWVVALTDGEAVSVDVPPSVYETGGGYSWVKRRGVTISPDDIALEPLDRSWFDGREGD